MPSREITYTTRNNEAFTGYYPYSVICFLLTC